MYWLFVPSLFDRVHSSSFRALPVRMHEKPPSVFVCRVLWIVDLWCKPMSYGGLPTDVENFITIAHREATQKWNGNKTNISGSTRCEIKISLVDQFGFRNNFARIFHNFISIQNFNSPENWCSKHIEKLKSCAKHTGEHLGEPRYTIEIVMLFWNSPQSALELLVWTTPTLSVGQLIPIRFLSLNL